MTLTNNDQEKEQLISKSLQVMKQLIDVLPEEETKNIRLFVDSHCPTSPPITFNLRKEYFDMIASGTKTAEGRINDGKFREVKEGDIITFRCETTGSTISKKVLGKRIFESIEEMVNGVEVSALIPGATRDEAVNVYHSIPGYTERSKASGVVAFMLWD